MLNITKRLAAVLASAINAADITVYPLPPDNIRLIGENTTHTVMQDVDSLEAIADKYKIGLLAMLESQSGHRSSVAAAGNGVDHSQPNAVARHAASGHRYQPRRITALLLPERGKHRDCLTPSVSVNWGATRRLWRRQLAQKSPTRPRPRRQPPTFAKFISKSRVLCCPRWCRTGPKNSMGLYALRLAAGTGTYLIQGTNANFGIGMRVSSGCIRLCPDDIETLFNSVPVGTRVQFD